MVLKIKAEGSHFSSFSSIHESTEGEFIGEIIYPRSILLLGLKHLCDFISVERSYNSGTTESINRFSVVYIEDIGNVSGSM